MKETENKNNGHRGMFSNGNSHPLEFPGVSNEYVFDTNSQTYVLRSEMNGNSTKVKLLEQEEVKI